jgi:hypothetical protein
VSHVVTAELSCVAGLPEAVGREGFPDVGRFRRWGGPKVSCGVRDWEPERSVGEAATHPILVRRVAVDDQDDATRVGAGDTPDREADPESQ